MTEHLYRSVGGSFQMAAHAYGGGGFIDSARDFMGSNVKLPLVGVSVPMWALILLGVALVVLVWMLVRRRGSKSAEGFAAGGQHGQFGGANPNGQQWSRETINVNNRELDNTVWLQGQREGFADSASRKQLTGAEMFSGWTPGKLAQEKFIVDPDPKFRDGSVTLAEGFTAIRGANPGGRYEGYNDVACEASGQTRGLRDCNAVEMFSNAGGNSISASQMLNPGATTVTWIQPGPGSCPPNTGDCKPFAQQVTESFANTAYDILKGKQGFANTAFDTLRKIGGNEGMAGSYMNNANLIPASFARRNMNHGQPNKDAKMVQKEHCASQSQWKCKADPLCNYNLTSASCVPARRPATECVLPVSSKYNPVDPATGMKKVAAANLCINEESNNFNTWVESNWKVDKGRPYTSRDAVYTELQKVNYHDPNKFAFQKPITVAQKISPGEVQAAAEARDRATALAAQDVAASKGEGFAGKVMSYLGM
jgi:hypothetical protein